MACPTGLCVDYSPSRTLLPDMWPVCRDATILLRSCNNSTGYPCECDVQYVSCLLATTRSNTLNIAVNHRFIIWGATFRCCQMCCADFLLILLSKKWVAYYFVFKLTMLTVETLSCFAVKTAWSYMSQSTRVTDDRQTSYNPFATTLSKRKPSSLHDVIGPFYSFPSLRAWSGLPTRCSRHHVSL